MVEKHNKYSIRKLSVGAASVFIGASFLAVNGKTVQADKIDKNNENSNTIEESTKEKEPEDTQSALLKDTGTNAENSKTDVDGNINSSVNIIKQENSGNNISNDVNKETAKENTTNIVDNSKIVENTSDANTIFKHDNTPQSNSQTKELANNIASAKKSKYV